jgi:hypothetical protein
MKSNQLTNIIKMKKFITLILLAMQGAYGASSHSAMSSRAISATHSSKKSVSSNTSVSSDSTGSMSSEDPTPVTCTPAESAQFPSVLYDIPMQPLDGG